MKRVLMILRRVLKWLLVIAVILVVAFIVFLKPTDVTPHRVSKGLVLVEALGTGSVESRQTIDVSFEVTARLVKIQVDQGDRSARAIGPRGPPGPADPAQVRLDRDEVAPALPAVDRVGGTEGVEPHRGPGQDVAQVAPSIDP